LPLKKLHVVFGGAGMDWTDEDCTYLHVRQPVFTFGANALTLFFLLPLAISSRMVEAELVDMTRWIWSCESASKQMRRCER
jgi:hypothetical protein